METENERDIVNGAQLPGFVDMPVSLVGHIQGVDSSFRSFNMVTTDDVNIKVNVNRPITGPLSGWVEVHGISKGKEIDSEQYILFSNEKFDSKGYNELCKLIYSITDVWSAGKEDEPSEEAKKDELKKDESKP